MTDIKQYSVSEPYLKLDCGLGEAPFWEEAPNILRFVDIVKCHLHTIALDEGPASHKQVELDNSIGTTADIEGSEDSFAFGGKKGYGVFDKKTASYKYIKKVWTDDEVAAEAEKYFRANDGAVDSQGRYWLGMMNDPLESEFTDKAIVFRLDPDMSLHRMIENVTLPNGVSWSLDDKTMYFVDSVTKNIWAYDFDAPSGNISNRRVFFHVDDPNGKGVPDGHAMDEHGYIWQAIHGMGKVVRISPEGKIVAEISLPTLCVTCPGFVGEDLFITSAEEEEPDKYPDSAKLQGSLFRCHVGVEGKKLHRFKAPVKII
ncbi:putative anterior fat body protein [Aulographum hederae CBS 113979]|uniref:Putative anterior fat body protein n=1 Tax=Aulographum hederae CBS 113979 TaxID=1176131 RepID=A0A6G1HC29_9PEZI|nr:putative anterior fat body protein [Aulographum hederae CBS 113979]